MTQLRKIIWVKRFAIEMALGTRIGASLARRFGVGSAPLPDVLSALKAHVCAHKIHISAAVLQNASWGGVRHRVGFHVEENDRSWYVAWCDSSTSAQQVAEGLTTSRNACLPMVNETLVALFPKWPPDDPTTHRVREAFASFRAASDSSV